MTTRAPSEKSALEYFNSKRLAPEELRSYDKSVRSCKVWSNNFEIFRKKHLKGVTNIMICRTALLLYQHGYMLSLPRGSDRFKMYCNLMMEQQWTETLQKIFEAIIVEKKVRSPRRDGCPSDISIEEGYAKAIEMLREGTNISVVSTFIASFEEKTPSCVLAIPYEDFTAIIVCVRINKKDCILHRVWKDEKGMTIDSEKRTVKKPRTTQCNCNKIEREDPKNEELITGEIKFDAPSSPEAQEVTDDIRFEDFDCVQNDEDDYVLTGDSNCDISIMNEFQEDHNDWTNSSGLTRCSDMLCLKHSLAIDASIIGFMTIVGIVDD